MDLFVLDTVGETSALEDRAVPIFGRIKLAAPSIIPQEATPNAQTTPSSFDDDDDDDEEDEDENEDYGDFPRTTCCSNDISDLVAEPTAKRSTPIEEATDRFMQLLRRKTKPTATNRRGGGASRDDQPEMDDSLSRTDVAREMRDTINVELEQQQALPNPSEKNKKKLRKAEASTTKGKNWYNMPATELTDEVKRDLEVIQMRSVLDPKHFYKKNDLKALPKYFQVGKVISSPLDHYEERGTRTQKKKTIVDELMADAQFQRFNKRKYTETVEEKRKHGLQKAHSKMKKLKKNK